jgi:hypothetical protein
MSNAQQDFNTLTKNIKDLSHKPVLRGTVEAELLKLGHNQEEVKEVLDRAFRTVTH